MITKRMIDEDVDNVREMLREHEFVIPGMWTVVWPLLVFYLFVVFMQAVFCIEYDFETHKSQKEDFSSLLPACAITFIAVAGALNARARYLCLPEIVRKKSLIVRYIRRKVLIYVLLWMIIFHGAGICALLSPDIAPITSAMSLLIGLFVLNVAFNIDMARFELSALNKIYDLWKDNRL